MSRIQRIHNGLLRSGIQGANISDIQILTLTVFHTNIDTLGNMISKMIVTDRRNEPSETPRQIQENMHVQENKNVPFLP